MTPKRKLLIVTFNYLNQCEQDVLDYMIDVTMEAIEHPAFGRGNIFRTNISATPVHMSRNRALCLAEEVGADYMLWVDSDMKPDMYIDAQGKKHDEHPHAERFFTSSINWMLQQHQPTIVAAPYCGPPPHENVYVFQWGNKQNDSPPPNFSVDQFSREHAASMRGITKVAALPTGLMLIDMRLIPKMAHPRVYYEFTDDRQIEKASTEDVTFTRDLMLNGYECYCNWNAWAGHWKRKLVGKPQLVNPTYDVLYPVREGVLKNEPNFYKKVRRQLEDEGLTESTVTASDHQAIISTNRIAPLVEAK